MTPRIAAQFVLVHRPLPTGSTGAAARLRPEATTPQRGDVATHKWSIFHQRFIQVQEDVRDRQPRSKHSRVSVFHWLPDGRVADDKILSGRRLIAIGFEKRAEGIAVVFGKIR